MSLNWTNLVAQGRARSIGIPWEANELELVLEIARKGGIPVSLAASFVREGVTSFEGYQSKVAGGEAPKTRETLEAEATEAGVAFDPTVTPDEVLEKETRRKNKKTK